MKTLALLLSVFFFLNPTTSSAFTHKGRLQVDVSSEQDAKRDSVATAEGKLDLNWDDLTAEVKLNGHTIPAKMIVKEDMVNSKGELLMKGVPQVHFDAAALEALLSAATEDNDAQNSILEDVKKNSSALKDGLNLVLYRCVNCSDAKKVELYSAFARGNAAFSEAELKIPATGAKSIFLKLKAFKIKAIKGAFHIIGNNRAGNFGN